MACSDEIVVVCRFGDELWWALRSRFVLLNKFGCEFNGETISEQNSLME